METRSSDRKKDWDEGTLAKTLSAEETARFWSRVKKGEPDECWPWGRVKAYGYFHAGGRGAVAHRLAYALVVGPLPEGSHLHHQCRNPRCVNPAHLLPVTPKHHRGLHSGKRQKVVTRSGEDGPRLPVLMKPSECAARLKVSRRTVYSYLRSGALPAFQMRRSWRVDTADLERFINSHEKRHGP